MAYTLHAYLTDLVTANVPYEKCGTGQYKGDYYVSGGGLTPHIHANEAGTFVGLKNKRGAMKNLVYNGAWKTLEIQACIDELKPAGTINETNVLNGLLTLARLHKRVG